MKKKTPEISAAVLQPLYAAWMDELLAGPIPPETDATCEDCAMAPKEGEPPPSDGTFFDRNVKCCGYVPELPNFLVGRILADDNPDMATGQATTRQRIQARFAVTPLGLGQPPIYALLYQHSGAAFGQSRTMRCPHYVEEKWGICSIWRHRNSVCVTYF